MKIIDGIYSLLTDLEQQNRRRGWTDADGERSVCYGCSEGREKKKQSEMWLNVIKLWVHLTHCVSVILTSQRDYRTWLMYVFYMIPLVIMVLIVRFASRLSWAFSSQDSAVRSDVRMPIRKARFFWKLCGGIVKAARESSVPFSLHLVLLPSPVDVNRMG